MAIKDAFQTLLVLLALSVAAVGHTRQIDEIETLPVSRIQMVKTGDKYVLMSGNGRFVFGSVHDMWNDADISSTEDVRNLAQRINLEHVVKKRDELFYYQYGRGEKQVAVFIDPLCQYCSQVIEDAKQLAEDYTFTFFPVALVNRRSAGILNALSCKSDQESLELLMGHTYPAEMKRDAGCKQKKQAKTLITAKLIGVNAVPFMIAPNHKVRKGGFTSPEGLKQFLVSNHD